MRGLCGKIKTYYKKGDNLLDTSRNRDLDLNSARNKILLSDNWINFEEDLAYLIFNKLSQKLSESYWEKLKEILLESKNEIFVRAIKKI